MTRLLMGLAAGGLIASSASGQFPGGEGGRGGRGGDRGNMGGGPGGMGGGGMMGGRPDPEMIWNMMGGQGKDAINLNDPANQRIKDRMMQRGQAIPANGMLTKTEFTANMQRSMAGGGMGGPPGMGGPGTATISGTPGGPMMMSVNGGPPQSMGAGGGMGAMSPDQIKQFMSRTDTDGDGRISMAEAQNSRGGLKDSFTQYDTNRDGFIDSTEYTTYLQARMSGGGMTGGGMNNGMNGGQPWNSQTPPPGGWGGGSPPSGFGGGGAPRERKKEDVPEAVVVHRFGNLPKELPSWFTDMDTDKDGQVGLYEWKSAGKKLDEFTELDLNGDGFLTADEWLRKQSIDLANREIEDRMANPNGAMATSGSRGGWSGGGSMRGGSPNSTNSGKPNPFTSGGPPGRVGRDTAKDGAAKDDKRDKKKGD